MVQYFDVRIIFEIELFFNESFTKKKTNYVCTVSVYMYQRHSRVAWDVGRKTIRLFRLTF